MKLISHRGNITGPDAAQENNPDRILSVLRMGFDVEVDVWLIDDQFFLGHDCPQYKIDIPFLLQEGVWCHSKNISALEKHVTL